MDDRSKSVEVPLRFKSVELRATDPLLRNATLLIGGHDVSKHIRAMTFRLEAESVPQVSVELDAWDGYDLSLPADVAVTIAVLEPGVLECVDEGDAGRRWVFKRQDAQTLQHTEIWLVGRVTDRAAAEAAPGAPWEFQGVFLTEAEAVAACRDEDYFIGPAVLGAALPHDTEHWPGSRYPLSETAEEARERDAIHVSAKRTMYHGVEIQPGHAFVPIVDSQDV